MEWKNMLSSEIEVSLKSMEFEYDKLQTEINQKIMKMDSLNREYIKGRTELDKRISENK